jgi:hypothetical protein
MLYQDEDYRFYLDLLKNYLGFEYEFECLWLDLDLLLKAEKVILNYLMKN